MRSDRTEQVPAKASALDTIGFALLVAVGLLAVLVAILVVFQENLVLYRDCGARAAGKSCLDAGTPVSLVLIIGGGFVAWILGIVKGARQRKQRRAGTWSALAAIVVIAVLTGAAIAIVAFSTR